MGQVPPQSTSLSVPLRAPSEHVGKAQSLLTQMPLEQSVALTQGVPDVHPSGQLPPQSMPVSAPFRTPSEHVGA